MSGQNIKRCIFLSLAIICSVFIISSDRDAFDQEQVENTEIFIMESGELATEMTETSQESGEMVEEIIAEPDPLPTYPFHIEEVTVQIPNLSDEYKLAWISDLHIIADVPLTDAGADVSVSAYESIQNRYDNVFVTSEGIHAVELWPEIVNWLNAQKLDGVILGGDMLDYYSEANWKAFQEDYSRIKAPVLFIRADHDYEVYYSGGLLSESQTRKVHETLDGTYRGIWCIDFPELMVVGINDSYKNISDTAWEDVKGKLAAQKPIILASHVPFASQIDSSLLELSMSLRGKEYYWGSESYRAEGEQKKLIEELSNPSTYICQVLAGHLHAEWDGMLNDTVPEHIFGPAYAGNIGIINVVSK